MMSTTVRPIPAPGLAIQPQYLSQDITTLWLKRHSFSSQWEIADANERSLFQVHSSHGLGGRKYKFKDALTGEQLFQIRTEGFGLDHFIAELPNSGGKLWDYQVHKRIFHPNETTISIANQADSTKSVQRLECLSDGPRANTSFVYRGITVADVCKTSSFSSSHWQATISPGMDPTVIASLMITIINRARARSNRAAAGAAAGGGGGGGGGGGC